MNTKTGFNNSISCVLRQQAITIKKVYKYSLGNSQGSRYSGIEFSAAS